MAPGEWSLGLVGGGTDHQGVHVGATVVRQITDWLTGEAIYGWTDFGRDAPDRHDWSVGVAAELGSYLRGRIPRVGALSLRPGAEGQVRRIGDLSVIGVRLSSTLGYRFEIESGRRLWKLYPFLAPLLVYRHGKFEALSETTWNQGLRGGFSLARGRYMLGLDLERVWTRTPEDRVLVNVGAFF